MTLGKCMRKNWTWKPVKSHLIEFNETDSIGTIKCTVESLGFSKEEMEEASKFKGFVESESSTQKLFFLIKGVANRLENLAAFNTLKSQLESSKLESADRAIICARKAERQISTIRCGAK